MVGDLHHESYVQEFKNSKMEVEEFVGNLIFTSNHIQSNTNAYHPVRNSFANQGLTGPG